MRVALQTREAQDIVTAPLSGRIARPEDDAAIRAFICRQAMPGHLRLKLVSEPSFRDALEVQGDEAIALIGERNGQILGLGTMATRAVHVNGFPQRVGYLGGLRLDESIRKTTALARGFLFLRRIHESRSPGMFYLTSILEQNASARHILTSGRAGLPAYRELFGYRTLIIPITRQRSSKQPCSISVRHGDVIGSEAITRFLQDVGSHRQFFPCYTREALDDGIGMLRHFRTRDLLVAQRDEMIVGTLGLWDQSAFRQFVVADYSRLLHPFVRLSNLISTITGWPPLPTPGLPIRVLLASCVAIRENSPDVFAMLLQSAIGGARDRGATLLALGLADNDPLLPTAQRFARWTLRSRIYTVDWGDATAAIRQLDGRPPYLELGSL